MIRLKGIILFFHIKFSFHLARIRSFLCTNAMSLQQNSHIVFSIDLYITRSPLYIFFTIARLPFIFHVLFNHLSLFYLVPRGLKTVQRSNLTQRRKCETDEGLIRLQ